MPDVQEHVVYDKLGKAINVGDLVSTKYRGGMHAGTVCDIAYNEQQAEEKGVQHPPKVIYVDQHGALIIVCSVWI